MPRFITGVAVGVTLGYLFSDLIDEVLDRSGLVKPEVPKFDVRMAQPDRNDEEDRIEEIDAATVADPVKVTLEELRDVAKRQGLQISQAILDGRWLISENEDGTLAP